MAKKYFKEIEKFNFTCKCGKVETSESRVVYMNSKGKICLDCFMKLLEKKS